MCDPSTCSRFRLLFGNALKDYEKQTGTKLDDHPFAKRLETCDSVESITTIFQEQSRSFRGFRGDDGKLMKPLKSAVHILHKLSASTVLGESIGLPFPPARAIFAGFTILLAAVKDVSASFDALAELLECIGNFLNRLDIYTKIPPTAAMTEVVVKIMVELISTLALATKQMKQGRPKKLVKKLLGENEVEAVLQRLDRLTQDEARTTAAQTLEVVYGLIYNMKVVMNDGKASADHFQDALQIMQQNASDINKIKRDKLRQDVRYWLSPPDPWKNHNTAYKSHHSGTSTWFIRGNTFAEWKTSGPSSLLWIHGKPGAGKSVLCSTIIENIDGIRKSGLAALAFFYCDFRDDKKMDRHGLLSSLLVQLCHQSDSYSTILSDFYLAYESGSRCPSDDALLQCIIHMLKHSGEAPVFIFVDALDELPNTTGMPSPRDEVLNLVEELVSLHIPNLRICVTSRPEADIQLTLDRLASHSISLHGESGQTQDIIEYVKSVVNTDPMMRRWKAVDKELVIDVLTKKADGMFRWVFCQLAYLRRCVPARIRRALEELPQTLDETYERTLQDIDEQNWDYAHRLFECVAVACRPLRVEELAEFLALDFSSDPIPTFLVDWRPEDPGLAVLSTCSSLLSIVQVDDSQVIEFSHFSVKEYLTSARLAKARDIVSRYHISLTHAHTIVAQACLGVLLHLDKSISCDNLKDFPLAEYSAQHWVDHARFEGVPGNIQEGMKRLFDPRKPHLAVWVWLYDPKYPCRIPFSLSKCPSQPLGSPLHYAAFCGLHSIAEFLIVECSQGVDVRGFNYKSTPLHEASTGKVAQLLLEHGADATAQDEDLQTPLHRASGKGNVKVARLLLGTGADVTAQDMHGLTPLHAASSIEVARLLLDHGANATTQDHLRRTPLHVASASFWVEAKVARLLLDHGADATAQDVDKKTPLHMASSMEVAQILLDHGADATAQDANGRTPLHGASIVEVVRLLLAHGADVTAQDAHKQTPLHDAQNVEVGKLLLDHGADATAQDEHLRTPLHEVSGAEMAQLLLERGADATARDHNKRTPLHGVPSADAALLLLEHGADATAQDNNKRTPLHEVSSAKIAQVLLEHGADVTSQDAQGRTPLHKPRSGDVARFLLEHGADPTARDEQRRTPLHLARSVEIARPLLEHGADATAEDIHKRTPLHEVLSADVAWLLLKHGADATARDEHKRTPLHEASSVDVAKLLLRHGADVTAEDEDLRTPLHEASGLFWGGVEVARLLLGHGANATAQDEYKRTPLHEARSVEVAQLLLEHGADASVQNNMKQTPLQEASANEHHELMEFLSRHGADDRF